MMMNRRTMLTSAAALAALAATGARAAGRKVGLQLYTVRNIFEPDPVGTLEKVAAIGYREVEYGGGGYDRMDHAMLRRAQDRLGLTAPSIHVGYDEMLANFDACVQRGKMLGADTLIVAYMTEEHRGAEAWEKAVGNFNRFAEKLHKAGLGFAYHNHHFEFLEKPGGVSLFDRMLKLRHPLVQFELDLFWAVKAGEDPKALIRRLAGDIYAYHVKDMTKTGEMASVGAGTMDFAAIFTLNKLAGVRHFYVENDMAPAPYIPDITASFQHLSKLLQKA